MISNPVTFHVDYVCVCVRAVQFVVCSGCVESSLSQDSGVAACRRLVCEPGREGREQTF